MGSGWSIPLTSYRIASHHYPNWNGDIKGASIARPRWGIKYSQLTDSTLLVFLSKNRIVVRDLRRAIYFMIHKLKVITPPKQIVLVPFISTAKFGEPHSWYYAPTSPDEKGRSWPSSMFSVDEVPIYAPPPKNPNLQLQCRRNLQVHRQVGKKRCC